MLNHIKELLLSTGISNMLVRLERGLTIKWNRKEMRGKQAEIESDWTYTIYSFYVRFTLVLL